MASTPALSAPAAGAPFDKTTIERRDLREDDVEIDIKFCGICHSDVHQARDEWGGSFENRARFGLEVVKAVREAA